jgi:predicted dehydrogenase
MVHAPVFAAGPETRLAGVWARRPEAARELAGKQGAPAFERYEDLLAACEAVAFAVAPSAQPEFAIAAARAGKALLLEKPLAASVESAERIAEAARAARVPTMLMLSYRFGVHVRAFLAEATTFGAFAARGTFLGGGFLPGSPFATPWRLQDGALPDLGPHLIDLAEAVLGPAVRIQASGDTLKVVSLLLTHESGAASTISLSGTLPFNPAKVTLDLYGSNGELSLDALAGGSFLETFATVRREFAETVRSGKSSDHDVEKGLHLQRLIAEAQAQLAN